MTKYASIAQNVANSLAAAAREKDAVDESVKQTANGMVADLQEFAADMNDALKGQLPSLGATVTASQWTKVGDVVKATVSVSRAGQKRDIPVEFTLGMSNTKVMGELVEGRSAATVIAEHIHRFLSS